MSDAIIQVRRARRNKGYEPVSRDMLQTRTLTLKARGLLALVESLPPDWECHGVDGIVREFCDLDGYTAVNNGIKELEGHGMWARLKRQGAGGKWEWLWTWSDDPGDVEAEVKAALAQGFKFVERGGNRAARTPRQRGEVTAPVAPPEPADPDRGEEPAGQAVHGFPEHGTMLRKPVHGPPVYGPAVHGQPPDIEIHSREDPPTPRSAGGDPPPGEEPPPAPDRCEEHGRPSCRPCGTSPRERARAGAARAAAELATVAAACRRRGWCNGDGWVRDPHTRTQLEPRRKCDHVTDPHTFVEPPPGRNAPPEQEPDPAPVYPTGRRSYTRPSQSVR